jgi:hypothetical protein
MFPPRARTPGDDAAHMMSSLRLSKFARSVEGPSLIRGWSTVDMRVDLGLAVAAFADRAIMLTSRQ